MALAKQFSKSKPVCKVTFSLSSEMIEGAKKVAVVGEFNQWDVTANVLKKQKDGHYKVSVELPVGQEFQFRYILDGTTWLNDEAADKYIPSGVSCDENSVVVL